MITGKTQKIQQRWVNKKTRTEAEQLEKHAAKMNMKPIWGYTKKIRARNQQKNLLNPTRWRQDKWPKKYYNVGQIT